MNIAFFGSSLVSAYWNGAATYYRGIVRALHDHGHSVSFYEPDAFERQQHRDIPDPDYARSIVFQAKSEDDVLAAVRSARGVDLVIKASGVGVFDELLESAVLDLQDRDTQVVFWDVDAPATLERMASDPADPFRSLIPEYDMILTYGGGPPVVSGYEALGARACIPIYNALDPTTHFPAPADSRFKADLGFLGNRMPDREARVRDFFFHAAAALPDRSFLLGGNGWDEWVPDLPNVRYLGHVYTRDHNAFNATPLAVLNINRDSMARFGYSPPTRIFEAAGAGACVITDAWEGIELFLTPGKECLVVSHGDELVDVLTNLNAAEARAIGERARERMLNEHTYDHRILQLQEVLSGSTTGATIES